MSGIIDMIKKFFVGSEEEMAEIRSKMKFLLGQSLNRQDVDEYAIVYGKTSKNANYIVSSTTTYYSYIVAFNKGTGEIIVVPTDYKLSSYGDPIFITNDSLKKAKLTMMGVVFSFDFKDKSSLEFEVPEINTKIVNMGGGYELAISQREEAKAFKQFFKNKYNC
ncbi:hypothetical protein HX017_12855 [Myroides marinus]|uniref:hypothetical protein n=1 Tax=Myroides marinus TaxID=703342 RepID=UPI0025764CAE|nr:hypothetical protein [Myroides marinus]MDM1348067.1 hypothetical protein [Myroides marinus]MDM1351627.1 hypothetical protein [Myroides marinus]MDM1355221.1 hypothetical protein [Myroides marinus]MDM1358834.1 hypothetical protein [Myroides marinus]MDM1361323.1 hypothetical protein [Myroides marinus]